jgi:hypothetical protein
VKIIIKTNSIIFFDKANELKHLFNMKNNNLKFIITYHYSYHDKDKFITSIKNVNLAGFNTFFIFLLPENETLNNYLLHKNDIINSINLSSSKYKYNLIKNKK